VAGGLFAQTVTWNGRVNAGLGFISYDGDDSNYFGTINREQEGNGFRAQIDGAFVNQNANAGLRWRLRTGGVADDAAWTSQGVWLQRALGWVNFMDGMFQVEAGRFGWTPYDQLDYLSNGAGLVGNNHGFMAHIVPISGMSFGVGALTLNSLNAGESENFENVNIFLGFLMNNDLFRVRASFTHRNESEGTTNGQTEFMASAALELIDNIPLTFAARISNLQNFGDRGVSLFHFHAGVNIIQDLGLNFLYAYAYSNADAHENAYQRFLFYLTFNMGNLVPRLDINYVQGGNLNAGAGLGARTFLAGYNYDSERKLITVSPSVMFRVTPAAYINVGYLAAVDRSDNDKAAFGSRNGGFNHVGFIDLNVTF
jgi:hypothetical protein